MTTMSGMMRVVRSKYRGPQVPAQHDSHPVAKSVCPCDVQDEHVHDEMEDDEDPPQQNPLPKGRGGAGALPRGHGAAS